MFKLFITLTNSFIIFSVSALFAQSPISPFLQGKNKKSFVVSYYGDSYNRFFLEKNANMKTFSNVTTTSISFFSTIGLSDHVDLQLNLPYVKAKGVVTKEIADNLGYTNEAKGIQDFSFFFKYNLKKFSFKKSTLQLLGASGLSFPLGNYKLNDQYESAVSIGSRSIQLNNLFVVNYKWHFGLFAIGTAGYSIKGNHVPDAAITEFKIGYAGNRVYFDVFAARQSSNKSEAGASALNESTFQLSNINYSRIGANIYVPIIKKVGVAAGYNKYISGLSKGIEGGYGALILNL
ncbi:hypothetical protein ACFOWM_03080 [Ferruginibacter yonginensis]|uniref:MetA-pathway of phenol degradation n=1 Tax=Ferruginibacter yonginensis TaxID=1310416 RepID=A0ABV8QNX9_9BACT